MSVKEFIEKLNNECYKILVKNIAKFYDIDLEDNMDCYEMTAGGYLGMGGNWLSLKYIFGIIEKLDEQL